MDFNSFGSSHLPTLVCIPGLLGGPEDFEAMLPGWSNRFHVMVLKPEHRNLGLNVSEKVMKEVSFNSSAEDIRDLLLKNNISQATLVGISLGGKVIYDFAMKFPAMFKAGIITDVGPGSFEESDLFQFVDQFVRNAPLHLPWQELKKHLADNIHDRSLKTLIQTQIFYPEKKPPAVWKTGMQNFSNMLQRQSIDNQIESLKKSDAALASQDRYFYILRASSYSGIGQTSLEAMRQMKSIRMIDVPSSTHFLHISHKDAVEEAVLKS